MADGDRPGGTGAGGNAAGGDGEDAVWLDLVARFDTPAPAGEAPPWPDREDLAGPVHVTPTLPPTAPEALPREPPTNPTGLPGLPVLGGGPAMPDDTLPGEAGQDKALPHDLGPNDLGPNNMGPNGRGPGNLVPDPTLPDQPWPGPRNMPPADDPASEHYVPPVPPPLPRLDPITKGAWLALFGGPLYLLISTAIGSTISGLTAFLAVAAFVGGFVILVLRMDNGRPPDSGSDDDGAVV
ncbi:MAG TPA: hypothetical protein VH594_20355 [Trebonia sp.]